MILPESPEWIPLSEYVRGEINRVSAHLMSKGDLLSLLCWTMLDGHETPVAVYPVTIEGVVRSLRNTCVEFSLFSADSGGPLQISRPIMHDNRVSTTHPTTIHVPYGDTDVMLNEAYFVRGRDLDQELIQSGLALPSTSASE